MANNRITINSLIRDNLNEMIKDPAKWAAFLTSRACRNYGLRFDQILSIYSFDPEAGECATYDAWMRCGRPVKHGSRGIPVLAGDGNEIKYYYPLKTTAETDKSIKLFMLGKQYLGIIGGSYDINQADYKALYASINKDLNKIIDEEIAAHETDWNNLTQGIKFVHPNRLFDQEAWTEISMLDLIQKSAMLMITASLETDPKEADLSTDFGEIIRQLDTNKMIIAGTMAANCARQYLVRCKQIIKEEMKHRKEKQQNGLDDRTGRGNSGADRTGADRDNLREVRDETEGIPAGDAAGDVRGAADPGSSGSTLRDDRRPGDGDGRIDYKRDDENGRDNRGPENEGSDSVDRPDEYDQSAGTGDRADTVSTERISSELIDEIIRTGTNHSDSVKRIVARIIKDCESAELAAFLKKEYREKGCMKGFQVGGAKIAVNADEEGLHISAGRSARGDGEITVSYADAARRIIDMYRKRRFIPSNLYTKEYFTECLHLDLEDIINKIYSIFPYQKERSCRGLTRMTCQ